MSRIKINRIIPQVVQLYDPENNYLGDINEYEFNDIRIQIMNNKVEGYYCKFNNETVFINKDGRLPYWPKNFFSIWDEQLSKLLKGRYETQS